LKGLIPYKSEEVTLIVTSLYLIFPENLPKFFAVPPENKKNQRQPET
jgi:hypothetical protein